MDGYVVKYAGSGIAALFEQLSRNSESRIEFIDPLCTVIKLGVLAYKKSGSKFSIKDNMINIQEPWTLQGFQRWLNSDERDQLHQLRLPILYFRGLEMGHISIENCDIEKKSFSEINELSVKGLTQLKATYENAKKVGSMVKNCLDDYIKTLTHPYSKEEYEKEIAVINKPTLFVIYNEFMKKWNADDISIIIDMFKLAASKDSENVQNKIADSIDHFTMAKDLEIDSLRPD